MMTTRDAGAEVLAELVRRMLAFRGYSPERLANSYAPASAPLKASTLRRIIAVDDPNLTGDAGDLKLMRLAGMLRLPPRALINVRDMDVQAIRHLDFRDETDVRQFVIETVEQAINPPRNRRATDKKRASR